MHSFVIHFQIPKSEQEWKVVAEGFSQKWNFPLCLGALDGKHIQIRKPLGTCSRYFNYKGTHSIVLFAVVNADYEFIFADVGTNGRVSDGGVIRNTEFYRLLQNNELNIPNSSILPNSSRRASYVFVGDEAFQLQTNLMKPFSQSVLNKERRIFNYRLSRARRIVENVFGIMASRFQVISSVINLEPKKVQTIVLACCYLHNFLKRCKQNYITKESVDEENILLGRVVPGNWRENNRTLTRLKNSSFTSSVNANEIRNIFTEYFFNEGKVDWQDKFT